MLHGTECAIKKGKVIKMMTDINEIRETCKNMDNEKLLEYHAKYSIYEHRRYIQKGDDETYQNYKTILDEVTKEILERMR